MARTPDPEKRLEIARAALAVLRDQGMHGTTMADIARALGMKRPTLYWYFPDVGSIFAFVYDRALADVAAHVGAALIGRTHPLDLVEALWVAEHDWIVAYGLDDYVLLFAQFWGGGGPEVRDRMRAASKDRLAVVRALLIGEVERGIREGSVAPCDAAGVVDVALALREGVMLHAALTGADPRDLHGAMRATVLDPLHLGRPGDGQRRA